MQLTVSEMSIRLCPDCFAAFRSCDKCAMCGSERGAVCFWIDESTDRLFQLVSDKSGGASEISANS